MYLVVRKTSSGGLVGYDAAFTRLRSRVQFPLAVCYWMFKFYTYFQYITKTLKITCNFALFYAPLQLFKKWVCPSQEHRMSFIHTIYTCTICVKPSGTPQRIN